MNEKVMPLSPDAAIKKFKETVPSEVLTCWNECIVENLKTSGKRVTSIFTLNSLKAKIKANVGLTSKEIEDKGYLDLEDLFRDQGWKVEFDKAAYNESYESFFKFSN